MDALISGLCDRTSQLLPLPCDSTSKEIASRPSIDSHRISQLRQTAAALIKISQHKLSIVIDYLMQLYARLHSKYKSTEPESEEAANELTDQFTRSTIIVFQLFSKALSAAINDDKLDLRFDNDFLAEVDELQDIRTNEVDDEDVLKQSMENNPLFANLKKDGDNASEAAKERTPSSPIDNRKSNRYSVDLKKLQESKSKNKLPSLKAPLARSLLDYIIKILFTQSHNAKEKALEIPIQLKNLAARVLFKLSVLRFDVVFGITQKFFENMKQDEVDLGKYNMIEFINFDADKLADLINVLSAALPKFKKQAYLSIAEPLRQAIWNWIVNYPEQFIDCCRKKSPLPGTNPTKLFESFFTFSQSKKNRQVIMWPSMIMLMLLTPDMFSNVIMAMKQNINNDQHKKQRKFIDTLKKVLRNQKDKQLSESSLKCFVDLYKTSTYVSKSDLSALRFLLSEIQNDTSDKLIPTEVSENSQLKIDQRLMVDFLVSQYRINQVHSTSYIVPKMIKQPNGYKLVMTKALLKISQEGAAMPWHPTLSSSYVLLAKDIRALFQDLLKQERKNQNLRQRNSLTNPSEATYCTETLLTLLGLFHSEPQLVLENTTGASNTHINDIMYLLAALCNCLSDLTNTQIQNQAYRVLQKLYEMKYIDKWCPEDRSNAFIELSSSVLTHISCMLVADKEIQGQNIKTLLELEKELNSSANHYLSVYRAQITNSQIKSRKRIQSIENAESALLVLLCCADSDIWTTAASCFGDLCDQIDILGDRDGNSIAANYSLYRRIAQAEKSSKNKKYQQKMIRKLLREMERQTKANLSAFIEVYSRWKTIKGVLAKSDPKDNSYARTRETWKNYGAFLCSLGGVCLQTVQGVFAGSQEERGANNTALCENLIRDMLKLITSENADLREVSTSILGSELSPSAFGILFQHLSNQISSFFGEDGSIQISVKATKFCQQCINILKTILDRDEGSDDLSLVDFESLVQQFVKYVSQLVLHEDTILIKISLCILIEKMMQKRDIINIADESGFRYELLSRIIEWTSNFELKSKSPSQIQEFNFKDLDALCMRAISLLLKDLNISKLKNDSGEDKSSVDRRRFMKYFTFLSVYLNNSKNDTDSHSQLREYTIASLSNLLESNINLGLEQFMKMAYLNDQETRSAFLHVLTTTMKQGITLEENEETEPREKYDKLLELVINDDLSVTFLLLSSVITTEQEDLCKALVQLFEDQGKVFDLLEKAIDYEVLTTKSSSTLFRANSPATKMLTSYFKLVGGSYLKKTAQEIVEHIVSSNLDCEIDPGYLKDRPSALEQNIDNLKEISQFCLDTILYSTDNIPYQFKHVCSHLGKRVNEKFPNNDKTPASSSNSNVGHSPKQMSIGGLIFLRLLNPMIVSPQSVGILDSSQANSKSLRKLMLVSKILQNIANGVKFKKSTFMNPLDPFVMDNLEAARKFFESVSTLSDHDSNIQGIEIDDRAKEESIIVLHQFLFNYIDKMYQISKPSDSILLEKLKQILEELGKPPEKSEKATTASGGDFVSSRFIDYINRIKQQVEKEKINMEEFNKVFYKSGISKSQRPVVYFISKNFEKKKEQFIIYHVLITLRLVFAKPYEIVFDCTSTKEENMITITNIKYLLKLLPVGAIKNLARVIVLNPNQQMKLLLNGLNKVITREGLSRLCLINGMKSLKQYIEEKMIDLTGEAVIFEKDVQTTISPAYFIEANGKEKPAVVKLSNRQLYVIIKDDKVLGKPFTRMDCIDIIEINENIKKEPHPSDQNIEMVSVSYGYTSNSILRLRTDLNDQLINNIKSTIARNLSEYRMISKLRESEGVRQEDIPGVILNMCFLNLESEYPKTRNAAYNLLATLAEQFDFPVTLVESHSVAVPHNTSDLVVKLSEKVASAKPLLTPTFLRESLRGFDKVKNEYRYLCIKYMKPWIRNLSSVYKDVERNQDEESIKQIQEWIQHLTKSTIDCKDFYAAMLSEFWGQISRDESLVRISIEYIMKEATDASVSKVDKMKILNDLTVTLASHGCSKIVMEAIISKIMEIFSKVEDVNIPLEKNQHWSQLMVYCRLLLMLSFQDRVNVVDNLPVLFHIILLMLARGQRFLRVTIHATTLNVVHSLTTSINFSPDQRKVMKGYLARLSEKKFLKIFMRSNDVTNIDPFMNPDTEDRQLMSGIPMAEVETITQFFVDIMKTCFQADEELRIKWTDEWSRICREEATKMNPVLLPRLLTVYGVVVKPNQAHETLPFVLDCLSKSFENYEIYNFDLPVACLLCLSKYCTKISPDDEIFTKFLLVPVFLLAASDVNLFPAVVHLLDNILRVMSNSQSFKECESIEQYFKVHCRTKETDPLISEFERIAGISFDNSFSFAFATLLMKGLTNQSTQEITINICKSLINISIKLSTNVNDILGFITALVPYTYTDLKKELGSNFELFSEEVFSHQSSPILFVRSLLAMVNEFDKITARAETYLRIKEGFEKAPRIFEPVFDDIMPRIITVYSEGSDSKISEVSLALINTMMSHTNEPLDHKNTTGDSLKQLKFTGLTRAASFKSTSEKQRSSSLNLVLELVRTVHTRKQTKGHQKKQQSISSINSLTK